MIKVKTLVFNYFEENTYLLIDEATKEAAVVDPGMMNEREQKSFDETVSSLGVKITQIINTHLHLDHCFGLNFVKGRYGVPAKAHVDDVVLGKIVPQQFAMFGLKPISGAVEVDVELKDGDEIAIGESRLKVIHVPGHTEGGIVLYDKADGLLFSGDTLFRNSIGRTDLPGGNQAAIVRSIRERLYRLPDDVKVFPGHGEPTTIGYEKRHNMMVRAN